MISRAAAMVGTSEITMERLVVLFIVETTAGRWVSPCLSIYRHFPITCLVTAYTYNNADRLQHGNMLVYLTLFQV